MDGHPVQLMQGRKRSSIIVHCGDGFFYNVREFRQQRVRLGCRHYKSRGHGCQGTASVSLVSGMLRHLSPHNHMPDPLLPQDLALRRVMIEEAARNTNGRSIRSILDDMRLRVHDPRLAQRFSRVRMCSAMFTARNETYPRIPHSLLHLGVLLASPGMRPVCRTADNADYIYQGVVGCEQLRTVAIIFASGRMLQFLSTRESIHVDGTFRKRPKKPKTSQIFNIVTKYGDNVVALVRVLMLSRTEAAYTEVLNHLLLLAPQFSPRRVHCDFERSLQNAFKRTFPQCRVVGCLWHYAVCVGLKSRTLGLAPLARENEYVMSLVSRLCAVPLLPHHLIWPGVLQVWREAEVSGWSAHLRPLFQYWEMEWKPRIAELSVFGDPDRTNNCSESDNRMMANAIPHNSPNIWFLIGAFVRLEYSSWCDKLSIDEMRPVAPARRYQTVMNDRRVRMASQMLRNGDITLERFLHSLSFSSRAAVHNGLNTRDGDVDAP